MQKKCKKKNHDNKEDLFYLFGASKQKRSFEELHRQLCIFCENSKTSTFGAEGGSKDSSLQRWRFC